jgi:thiol:disulfide interchange protein DsbA
MRFIQQALAAVSFGLLAVTAGAAPSNPIAGTDYRVLERPQQVEAGNKVEVTEFFWYSCPHCFAFEPALEGWVKSQGDKIVFKRVPVGFKISFVPQQKLYYALEAMGKLDELHKKVFEAIHLQRQRLDTEAQIVDFIAAQGVDKAKFLAVFNSFAVQSKVGRIPKMQQDYGIDSVPMVAIGGRFVTAPHMVGAQMRSAPDIEMRSATLEVMSALVAKAAQKAPAGEQKPVKEKKPAKAKEKAAAPAAKPKADK